MAFSFLRYSTWIVVAQASFTDTVNLGAILVGLMLVVGFAWASRKDKRSERWEKLYDLADAERKEIQSDLEEAKQVVAEQKEVIQKLDTLQMPIKIVEFMNESVERIDAVSRVRLEQLATEVHDRSEAAEERAQERHELQMEILFKLVERVEAMVPKAST